jgi:hypothetical protein
MAIDRINTGLSGVQPGGMAKLIPVSIAKGASGTATVDSSGTVTFSGTESISLNDIFSANYDVYFITSTLTGSTTNAYAQLRLRASNSDASGSDYVWGFIATNSGGTSFTLAGSGATSSNVTRPSTTDSVVSFTITNPFLARKTIWSGTTSYNDGATVTPAAAMGGAHSLTNSYTGFTLLAASGTITGNIRVYGYA